MDIKKIVRRILSEQPADENVPNPVPQLTRAQRELLARLTAKWRETIPEITDEDAMTIFNIYRESLPQIKDETQQAVRGFILRGNGKYTVNDLKDGSKVNIKDLLLFLKEFKKFDIKFGDGEEKVDSEKKRLDDIFNTQGMSITPYKIEESKKMWEGENNLIINEGPVRVYSVNTREEAQRYGYYYQEKLKELIINNIETKRGEVSDIYNRNLNSMTRYSATPWCVFSRGDGQKVMYGDRLIINPISNMYTSYRTNSFFYLVIDESKDLFGPGGEYYISTIMKRSDGGFKIASMYNGEYNISREELIKIYPQLNGHLDEFTFRPFDRTVEVNDNVPLTILEIINEIEGSPNAFWMQGPDEKSAFINAGGQLKNPKSWETMSNELREQYINSIQLHDARQKIGSEEFMKAIIKSGTKWKTTLNRRMITIGTSGIGYLADDFMKANYGPDFFGKKNNNIRIYKNKHTKKYGIYDIEGGDWITKDGITYEAEFTMRPLSGDHDIFDDENDKIYMVSEFTAPNGPAFYTLKDMDEAGYNVYILSQRKYNELKEKVRNQGNETDIESDADIGEQQL